MIAEHRITGYDGKRVDFWYQAHRTERRVEESVPVAEFIGRLVMHIPKKHSRMVHRYDLYRRHKGKLSQSLGGLLPKRQLTLFSADRLDRKTWRERATESFGSDPVICPHCANEMELWEVWHHFLYHCLHEDETPIGGRMRRYGD